MYPISRKRKLLNILIAQCSGAFGQLGRPAKLNPNKRSGDYLHTALWWRRGILLVEKDARVWLFARGLDGSV